MKKETIELAYLNIQDSGGESIDLFRGAVRAAERLGYKVTVREARHPSKGNVAFLVASVQAEVKP